jgi:hypothetical protein
MQTGPSPSDASASGGSSTAKVPAVRYYDRARRWVVVPLAIGAFLLFAALFGGVWWETGLHSVAPVSGLQHEFVLVHFEIGGSVTCVEGNWTFPPTPCSNLTERTMTGSLGRFYADLPILLAALGGVAVVVTALVLLGNLRILRRRVQLVVEIGLVVALAAASFAIPLGTALAGPAPPAGAICYYLSGNNSTCPGFWGSTYALLIPGECNVCKNTVSWGAGDAFYQTVAAGVFFAGSAVVLAVRRRQPFTLDEEVAWAARYRAIPAPDAAPPSPPAASEPPPLAVPVSPSTRPAKTQVDPRWATGRYVMPTAPWVCPQCGTQNLQWSNLCRSCGGDRPQDPEPGR